MRTPRLHWKRGRQEEGPGVHRTLEWIGRNDAGEAIEVYRAARAINKDAGVVGRVLRLFDTLAESDAAGALAGVRAAAAGE